MSNSNSPIVYSTDKGRIISETKQEEPIKGDGVVRIQRQTSGRKGKAVCVITGIALPKKDLSQLLSWLKKKCGCGGALKQGVIEIQGDKREQIKQLLEEKGMKVKFSGG